MARVLLDTHVMLWWLSGDDRLRAPLPLPDGFVARLPEMLRSQHIDVLDVGITHALRAGSLPGPHRDPFDRMIAAQALVEGLPVASADTALDGFGVRRVTP